MPTFPSLDWMRAYAEALAAHPQGAAMAAALDGRYRFVIEPGGPVTERHAYELLIAPGPDRQPPRVRESPETAEPVALEIAAVFPRWRDLVEGRLDLLTAMLLRRIRVSGDVGRLRSRLADARPLLDSLQAVPTDWPT